MPVAIGPNWTYIWQPGQPTLQSVKEATVLRYTISMPAKPSIGDLANREVTISLNNVPTIRTLHPDDTSFQFDTDDGVNVSIVLVDIDTSGNRSAPSAPLAFTAEDTIPPPTPGALGVSNVEQI